MEKRYEYDCNFLVYEVDRQKFSNMAFNILKVNISYFPSPRMGCWIPKFSDWKNEKLLKTDIIYNKTFLYGLYTGLLGKLPLPNYG